MSPVGAGLPAFTVEKRPRYSRDGELSMSTGRARAGRVCVVALIVALVVAGPAGAAEVAWVSLWNDTRVRVVDGRTATVVDSISVGYAPRGVAVDRRRGRVYVANECGDVRCGDEPQPGTLSIIDGKARAVVASVPVGLGANGVAVNRCGTRVYVSNRGDNTLSVVDPAAASVVATVPVGIIASGVAVHPSGATVYVAGFPLTVVDATTNAVVATVPVGSFPEGIVVERSGRRVWVASCGERGGCHTNEAGVSTVYGIDTGTNAVVATVPLPDGFQQPGGLAVDRRGRRLYVATSTDVQSLAGLLWVIDPRTAAVVGTIPVGDGPAGVALSRDGRRVYVASSWSNALTVVDARTATVVDSIELADEDNPFPLPWSIGDFLEPRQQRPSKPCPRNAPRASPAPYVFSSGTR